MQFTFVVGLLALFLFCYGFLSFAIQRQDSFHKTCLTDGLELQKNILQQERLLFALNPLSTAYRIQLYFLYVQLAANAEIPPAAAAIIYQINVIKNQQEALDAKQKLIIETSRQLVRLSLFNLIQKFKESDLNARQNWQAYLSLLSQLQITHTPDIAVVPDSLGGTAPNYELKDDYQSLQTLALKWHLSFLSKESAQRYLNSEKRFSRLCQIIPEKRGWSWFTKIKVDRY